MVNNDNNEYPSIVKSISFDENSLRLAERLGKADGRNLSEAVRRCITKAAPGLIKKAKST